LRSAGGAGWLCAHLLESSFSEKGKPMRLIQQSVAKDDLKRRRPSAATDSLYVPELDETWLRFVDGRPVRPITRRAFFRGAPESSKRLARGRWFSSGTKRLLARLQGGLRRWLLASTTEKKSKRERERERERERQRSWSKDREVPAGEAESMAQCHRAEVVGTRGKR
jgi:hypothetical protein